MKEEKGRNQVGDSDPFCSTSLFCLLFEKNTKNSQPCVSSVLARVARSMVSGNQR